MEESQFEQVKKELQTERDEIKWKLENNRFSTGLHDDEEVRKSLQLQELKEHITRTTNFVYDNIDANIIKNKIKELHPVLGELYALTELINRPGQRHGNYDSLIEGLYEKVIDLIEGIYKELDRVNAFDLFELMQTNDIIPVLGVSFARLPENEKEFFKDLGIDFENSPILNAITEKYGYRSRLNIRNRIDKFLIELRKRKAEKLENNSNKREHIKGLIKVGGGMSAIGLNILGTVMIGQIGTWSSISAGGWAIIEGMAEFNYFTTGQYFIDEEDRY